MVECHLAKVDVEGSNPFSRSTKSPVPPGFFVFISSRLQRVSPTDDVDAAMRGTREGIAAGTQHRADHDR